MKKKIYMLATAMMLGIASPAVMAKGTDPVETKIVDAQNEARLNEIRQRAEQIKSMDKSQLNRQQRQDLRKEVKELKKEAEVLGRGVYLSVGAIIIIILLAILIF